MVVILHTMVPLEGSEHVDQTLRCTKQNAPGWGAFCVTIIDMYKYILKTGILNYIISIPLGFTALVFFMIQIPFLAFITLPVILVYASILDFFGINMDNIANFQFAWVEFDSPAGAKIWFISFYIVSLFFSLIYFSIKQFKNK